MNASTSPAVHLEPLIVDDLHVSYVDDDVVRAVVGVSFSVQPGEVLGIVGESGSGKSSIASAMLRLLPRNARIGGRVLLDGQDLVSLSESQMRRIRGRRLGMIFQDPATALNPVFTIRTQIVDTVRQHRPNVTTTQAQAVAAEMVEEMGIPAGRLGSYPHQLSGGMRQRALIAAAMAAGPSFLVADEPTSDLDTISQAQILRLLRRLCDERGVGLVLISHDLAVIGAACDRVIVMHSGYLIEVGRTHDVLTRPLHPYTQALLRISRKDRDEKGRFVTAQRAEASSGSMTGCPYFAQCPVRLEHCDKAVPDFRQSDERLVRCYLYPALPDPT